jgi:hypothetical protein
MFNLSIRLLLGRHRVRVIPIILRACDWQDAPFGKLQALPKDAKPVTNWSNRDEAFLCVEQGIRETVEELWTRRMHKLKNQIYEFENQFEQAEARKQQAKPLKIELENEFANAEAIKQQMDRWKILEESLQPQRRLPDGRSRKGQFAFAAATVVALISLPSPLAAQSAESDAQDARIDAILATPSLATPVPQSNLIATAPGLEQQAASPQFTFNFLAPFAYTSNAEQIRTGGTPTLELSPVGNLSWAAPLFDLPVRLSANVAVENDRFIESGGADLDKIGGSLRLQYVDPNNDQAFSPYVAYAPRFDFLPTFSEEVETRQDVNLGFNKRFNFDGRLLRLFGHSD